MNNKALFSLAEHLRLIAADIAALVPSEETKPPAEQQEPTTIRLEDVRAVLAAKSRDGYGQQIRDLIKKHGGTKLSDINPSEYAAILQEAEAFKDAAV